MGDAARLDTRFLRLLPRVILASALMGIVLHSASLTLSHALQLAGWRYLALAGLVATGAAVYFAAARLMGENPLRDLRRARRGTDG